VTLGRSAAGADGLGASIAAGSVTSYAIEASGLYDEEEVREKIRACCDENGFFAKTA
jgi:hypothetical protein